MSIGIRHAVLLLAGITAVLLTISFTACGLTTYDSIRGIIGDIAAEPEQVAALHDQYGEMTAFFGENKGDTYTFRFGGLPLSVNGGDVTGLSEQQTVEMVLDIYTSSLYHVNYRTGVMGSIGDVFNASGNRVYTTVALLVLAGFVLLAVSALLPFWGDPLPVMLKDEGKVLVIVGVLAFFVFLAGPAIVKSMVWDAIPSIDNGREIVKAIESHVISSLLLNDILLGLVGLLVYAVGFVLGRQSDIRGSPEHEGSRRLAPRVRGTARSGPQSSRSRQMGRRRGL